MDKTQEASFDDLIGHVTPDGRIHRVRLRRCAGKPPPNLE